METDVNTGESSQPVKKEKKSNLRVFILLGLLLVVGACFLYDKYVLLPSAEASFEQFVEKVADRMSPSNKEDTHEILGFGPFDSFEYKGLTVERYDFPRGLPFYPGAKLDVAFKDGALFCFRQDRITEQFLDERLPHAKVTEGERGRLEASAVGQ